MEYGTYKFSYTSPNGEKTKVTYICDSDRCLDIEEFRDMCMSFAKALGYTCESIKEYFKDY